MTTKTTITTPDSELELQPVQTGANSSKSLDPESSPDTQSQLQNSQQTFQTAPLNFSGYGSMNHRDSEQTNYQYSTPPPNPFLRDIPSHPAEDTEKKNKGWRPFFLLKKFILHEQNARRRLFLPPSYYPKTRPIRRILARKRIPGSIFYLPIIVLLYLVGALIVFVQGQDMATYFANPDIILILCSIIIFEEGIDANEYGFVRVCRTLAAHPGILVLNPDPERNPKFHSNAIVQHFPTHQKTTQEIQSQFHLLVTAYLRPILDLNIPYIIIVIVAGTLKYFLHFSRGFGVFILDINHIGSISAYCYLFLINLIHTVSQARSLYYIFVAIQIFLYRLPSIIRIDTSTMISSQSFKVALSSFNPLFLYNALFSYFITFFVVTLVFSQTNNYVLLLFVLQLFPSFVFPHLQIFKILRTARKEAMRFLEEELSIIRSHWLFKNVDLYVGQHAVGQTDPISTPLDDTATTTTNDAATTTTNDTTPPPSPASSSIHSHNVSVEIAEQVDNEFFASHMETIAHSSNFSTWLTPFRVMSAPTGKDPDLYFQTKLIDSYFILSRMENVEDSIITPGILAKLGAALMIELPAVSAGIPFLNS